MIRVLAIFLSAYTLHFAWEMAHAKWFETMNALQFWTATVWCARAALSDVVISAGAYGSAALLARTWAWPRRHSLLPSIAYLGTGLAVTVLIERWAVATGRWAYEPAMITIGGVGLSPLLQWIVVPILIAVVALLALPAHTAVRATAR